MTLCRDVNLRLLPLGIRGLSFCPGAVDSFMFYPVYCHLSFRFVEQNDHGVDWGLRQRAIPGATSGWNPVSGDGVSWDGERLPSATRGLALDVVLWGIHKSPHSKVLSRQNISR